MCGMLQSRYYSCVVCPYLVLLGCLNLLQSIFGTAGLFKFIAVHIWYCYVVQGSPYLVLPGGLVQSIFGSARWFGAVHTWYCWVVRCSPYLVLLGGLLRSMFGTAE